MKYFKSLMVLAVTFLPAGVIVAVAQQGPATQSSETVAKPRKKDTGSETPTAPDQEKIPSKFNKKDKDVPEGLPTFTSNVTTIQVDVSVLDNKGRFIPKIPQGNFRVLEDTVPQQITSFNTGNEAPMTVALVIEFSNLFQQYWSEGWYQTLTAAYGFVETLKSDDYVAVVAFDLKSEILSDFSTDRRKTMDALAAAHRRLLRVESL